MQKSDQLSVEIRTTENTKGK